MGDRAWWERGTQDSLIWTQIHSMNANTYRAKIKCVRFLYRYSTYNTGQGHSVTHVAENSYTQTSKCSQQKSTNKSYKQCVCIYTRMHQHQTWPNTGHNMERVPQSF